MISLETQEAGTGKWFSLFQYAPGTDDQRESAEARAEFLTETFGLYTRVIEDTPALSPDGDDIDSPAMDALGDDVQQLCTDSKANVVAFVLFDENSDIQYRSRLGEETLRRLLRGAAEVL